MKNKNVFFAAFLVVAILFAGCKPSVSSPVKPDKPGTALEIENARSAAVSDSVKATVVLAWKANNSVILGCKEKAGNLKNEVPLPKGITEYIVEDLDVSTEYHFYWKDYETGEIKAELSVKTPEAGKVDLDEKEKDALFQERLLEYLNDEKKTEIFNEILEEKRNSKTFLELLTDEEIESLQDHSLTDEEKLAIFEEIFAGKRTSAWIISQLTEEEKNAVIGSAKIEELNAILTEAKKLAIFDQILLEKRNDGTFLELLTDEEIESLQDHSLTDEEKLAIFEEIFAGKRTSAWIISQLTEEEKNTVIGSAKIEELNAILTEAKKLAIFDQILLEKRNDGTFLELLTDEEIESLQDHSLTDEEKLAIFEEIFAGKRTSAWIISQLTDEEKNTVIGSAKTEELNAILTEAKKLAIFDQILLEKRNDGTFLELLTDEEIESLQDHSLTDEEKLAIFEEIFAGKRTSAWIISQLTDDEMEIIIGSLTAEDLRMLLEEKDKVPPAKVTDFKADIVGDKIRLSWTDAKDDDVLCYEIKYSKSVAVRSVSFDSESIIVPQGRGYAYLNDLEEDTKYSFEIRTMDTTGNKSDKAVVECTVWKQAAEPVMDISNSYYKGVLLYISEDAIPEDADVRYIIFNGNLIAQTDYNEPKEDRYKENEWGYPYVKKGNTYTFQIEYRKNGTILKEYKIEVKAKSGLGELKTIKQPAWKYENYSVLFTQQPEVTLNGRTLPDSVAYAVAQPFEPETFAYYAGIPFDGITYDAIDIAHVLENKKPEEKVTLNLRFIFPSEKYGDYIWKFFTNEQENAFVIDWENYSPYLTFDRSYDGLKFTIDSSVIPANATIRDIFLNEDHIQCLYHHVAVKGLEFAYPYVEKGKSYVIKIIYSGDDWKAINSISQEVVAWGGKGDVELVTSPEFTVSDVGVRHIDVYPKIKIGSIEVCGKKIPENGYYNSSISNGEDVWITSKTWGGDPWIWDYDGAELLPDWDMGAILRKTNEFGKEGDFYFQLIYDWADTDSDKYGLYRIYIVDSREEFFTINWNKFPNTIWDASDAETVGVKIEYNITPEDLRSSRDSVILFVNDMPTMPIMDQSGVIEVPYVIPGMKYKVQLVGLNGPDNITYEIGRPITVESETGLLSVIQPGEFSIDNNTGTLKITKEPKLRLEDQTVESGYMYLLDVLYKGSLHPFESQEPFEGTEFNIADAIFGRDIDPGLENAEIKIKLAAALELGTKEDPLYCFVQFTTDENPDGLFDVNLNWSQIKKPIEIIAGEDVNGIKMQIRPSVIPEKATDIKVSLGDSTYDFFPVSQNEIEITNVLPGNTYDLVVSFGQKVYFTESFWVYFTNKEYSFTVTPETGNVSCEGGSYSVNNGILSFTKPVLRLNGDEKTDIYYYLKLEYKDIFSGEYKHDSDLDISSLREGNTYLLEKAYEKYSEDNITDFRFTIEIRKENINDEVPFAAIMVKDIPFSVDWSQMPSPYEILSDGSSGIKIKINEDFFSEEYEGYNFYIDDFQIIGYKSDNLITYPDVLPGANYNLKIGLFFINGKWSYYYPEFTPSTGNISLESPAEFQMDNGVLTLVTPPVIKRLGEEIQDVKYTVVYKMKSLDGQYDSSVNNLSLGRGNRINIFRESFDSYKNNTIGYAYKVYAYSDDSSAPYIVPLMEDFVEESVDWDNVERPYKIITAAGEPGVKVKINQYEIPEGAEYIESALNSNFVMVQKVTEGDNIVYYPYVYVSDRYSFSISFSDKDGHLLGNTIYLYSNSYIPYEYTVSPSGAVSLEGNILKVTENPGIELPGSEEDLFNLDEFVYEWKDTEGANHGGYLSKDQNGDSYWIFDEEKISSMSKLTVFAIFTQKINDKEYVSIKVPFAVINK